MSEKDLAAVTAVIEEQALEAAKKTIRDKAIELSYRAVRNKLAEVLPAEAARAIAASVTITIGKGIDNLNLAEL